MKKLSIEEKAKAYDEALKEANVAYKDEDRHLKATLERIFPVLKESEDERIRKAIIIYFDWLDGRKDYAPRGEYSIRDMVDWLEKQGEQKHGISELTKQKLNTLLNEALQKETPESWNEFLDKSEQSTAWSEEDERIRKGLIHQFTTLGSSWGMWGGMKRKDILAWLEKQEPVEWNEEDDAMCGLCTNVLSHCQDVTEETKVEILTWLERMHLTRGKSRHLTFQ